MESVAHTIAISTFVVIVLLGFWKIGSLFFEEVKKDLKRKAMIKSFREKRALFTSKEDI